MQTGEVLIPVPAGNTGHSTPMWIASDGTGVFGPASAPFQFVVVTQEGTIAVFSTTNGNLPAQAALVRDDSASGAVYTALALLQPNCCAPYAAVANFHDGLIHTFTSNFDLLAGPGSFQDPNLPAGYAPYGMQVIGSQLFITYAVQNAGKNAPVAGAGNGIVDVFDAAGNFVRRFATGGSLNAPSGAALASASFGPFSGAILVANSGDGTISAFDATSGNLLGQLSDGDGNIIVDSGIRGLAFRVDGAVDPNTLFFAATTDKGDGLFGAITGGLVSSTRVFAPGVNAGAAATVTATVNAGPRNPGAPTGTVLFVDSGATLGAAPLIGNVASFTLPNAGMGMHAIDAHFAGDAAFLPSSSSMQLQITGLGTSLALSVPATAVHGSPVTMTATISSPSGAPTGMITFHEGSLSIGSATMNAMGVATITVSNLSVGSHSLTASFAGSGNFSSSSSPTAITDVSGAADFAVAATPAGVTVSPGQSAPVMVTVTPANGFNSNVTLSCSSVPGVTCTFVSATLTTTAGAASTTMNVNTTTAVPRYGFLPPGGIGLGGLLAALALFGYMISRSVTLGRARVPFLATATLLAAVSFSLALGGCGYGNSYTPPANPGPAVMTITAQSGTLTHTTTVNVTVH